MRHEAAAETDDQHRFPIRNDAGSPACVYFGELPLQAPNSDLILLYFCALDRLPFHFSTQGPGSDNKELSIV
jgi:hypothetical protein